MMAITPTTIVIPLAVTSSTWKSDTSDSMPQKLGRCRHSGSTKLAGPPRKVRARGYAFQVGEYFRSARGRNTYVVLESTRLERPSGRRFVYTHRLLIAPIVPPAGAVVRDWAWDR